ncbi:hypothetical protein F4861DRAFT_279722 [Xylaria intraflava]|nr:hypothetical protein F4861DRAFT_279722 [Xylaria intraflava]
MSRRNVPSQKTPIYLGFANHRIGTRRNSPKGLVSPSLTIPALCGFFLNHPDRLPAEPCAAARVSMRSYARLGYHYHYLLGLSLIPRLAGMIAYLPTYLPFFLVLWFLGLVILGIASHRVRRCREPKKGDRILALGLVGWSWCHIPLPYLEFSFISLIIGSFGFYLKGGASLRIFS